MAQGAPSVCSCHVSVSIAEILICRRLMNSADAFRIRKTKKVLMHLNVLLRIF